MSTNSCTYWQVADKTWSEFVQSKSLKQTRNNCLTEVVVGSEQTVWVRADPFSAASTVDADELCVAAVRARRRSELLRTERRACVAAVLAGTQLTAVRLEFLAVLVRLAKRVAVLPVTSCTHTIHVAFTFIFFSVKLLIITSLYCLYLLIKRSQLQNDKGD